MNAGKSTALLQVAYNYEENGHRVLVFSPHVDDRYGRGKVTSRLGPMRDAVVFNTDYNFLSDPQNDNVACILIDEAQFLTKSQVMELHRVAHLKRIPVMTYGLRTDFMGEPFHGSIALLALADEIKEIKTICACQRKATMNIRIDECGKRITSGDQIAIGGNAQYKQLCARCFYFSEDPV